MYLFAEDTGVRAVPTNVRNLKNDRVRMECVLQTAEVFNRNRRQYPKSLLQEGVNKIAPRIKEGSLLGELDHPSSKDPIRQITVLYKEASHIFRELGWDGNKLTATIDTLTTRNGKDLRALVDDGVAIGWSFRGMGDLKETLFEGGRKGFIVQPPLHIVTWDSVSFPSHEGANMIRVTEGVTNVIRESLELNSIEEKDGMVCLENGVCYFPNDFDKLVEQKIIQLKKKFEI